MSNTIFTNLSLAHGHLFMSDTVYIHAGTQTCYTTMNDADFDLDAEYA